MPGLNAIKVPVLNRLMYTKFEQNPDYLQDLIDTAPLTLIEESWEVGKLFELTDNEKDERGSCEGRDSKG